MKQLKDILPIWCLEHEAILSKMGDVTIGYEIQLPEIFTLSEEQHLLLHHAWLRAIKTLPSGTVLYKQDWFVEEKYQADFAGKEAFLARASERHFMDRPYLDHSCYVFLTKKPNDRKVSSSAFSSLLRRHIVPVELLDEKFLADFNGVCGQFERILSDTGFVRFERMSEVTLTKSINRYLALGDDGLVRDLSFEGGIKVGEKHCELFSLSHPVSLPSQCGSATSYDKFSTDKAKFPIGFASPIGQLLSCSHVYSQYVFIEDVAAIVKRLESKKLRLQSFAAYSRENLIARDAVNDYLNEAVGGHQLPVKAHFNLLAWTDEAGKVRDLRSQCAAAFAQMDVSPRIETVGGPQIYWAGIPGNAADFPMNDAFDIFASQAVCFLNSESSCRSSVSPIGVRLGDRISGKPLHVDISDELIAKGLATNRNKLIIGPSGTGKSFATNHILHAYHAHQSYIVVVDMGNSYAGLCELLGGYYFTYTEDQPIRFNPFYLEDGLVPDTEKKESLKTLLVALWKKEDESFRRSEYVALSNALQLYYEKEVAFRCFDSFYEFLRDEYVEVLQLEKVKDNAFDVSNFLYVLRPFYRGGEFDYLLNASENLDVLQQRFIVFEIDTIKDHPILFPVVTLVIMELFIGKMRKLPGLRKMILIEEAWKAIAKAGMAEYIKYLYKTVRKYYGEAIVVTQDLDDILSSAIIKDTIINNADVKILLDQSKYQARFTDVQEMLGLPDGEVPKILSMNKANDPLRKYKEVYIWPLGKVYRVEVSPEEYLCYTTEEKEKLKVKMAAQKYGSMEKGIKGLVMTVLVLLCFQGNAQVPVLGDIISTVIKTVDLKIQKLQYKQLLLQQLQKQAENKLHELKLAEIRDWTDKQRRLYQDYFEELRNVNTSIVNAAQLDSLRRQIGRQ
jgi:conjugation system TraG family ATPase